jgi:putative transcriptional regulator
MRDELFDELVESVREGMQILNGEREASREFEIATTEIDVGAIRKRLCLSRTKFAALLGISARTVEGWEQGRRRPEGPARTLLLVASKHPEAVLDAVMPA